MKWRPNATRSASPEVTMASAEAGVKPPAAIKVLENFGLRYCAAVAAPARQDLLGAFDAGARRRAGRRCRDGQGASSCSRRSSQDRCPTRIPRCRSAQCARRLDPLPRPNGGLHHLQQEAGAVFDGTAVSVSPLVRSVLQELVTQVAVGAMDFDAINPARSDRSAPSRNSSMMPGCVLFLVAETSEPASVSLFMAAAGATSCCA